MVSPLSALASIISSGVQTIETVYTKHGMTFPSLDNPFEPGILDENPALIETSNMIIAAAAQIIAAVRPPKDTIRHLAPSMYMTASLGFVVDTDVPEILRDAGPKGLHANDIAAVNGTNPSKIGRILRYLATRHVFREVTPNVFANNRISSVIVKSSKTHAEIQEKPLNKYDDAGIAAYVGHFCDEGLKGCAHMIEYLKDPTPTAAAPLNLALDTKLTMWEWFNQPGNEWRLRRFMAAMTHEGNRFKDLLFTSAIDWKALKANDVVVDVGGNIGTVTFTLIKEFPHLNYVVQDLDGVIENATKVWQVQYPEAIADGRVKLQAHNFFQPQPVKDAAVYFMRLVLHDWADVENKVIMKNLRAAGNASSKLILFELSVPYACPDSGPFSHISSTTPVPYPLLANLGIAGGGFSTFADLQMMSLFNGQERTLGEFIELGNATGWKLEAVKEGMLKAFIYSTAGPSDTSNANGTLLNGSGQ